MRLAIVKEGNSGVLYLFSLTGRTKIFVPDCDLDKAQKNLHESYQMPVGSGGQLSSSFNFGDFDWFPAVVSRLYWHHHWPAVQYQELLDDWLDGKIHFLYVSPGKFRNFVRNVAPTRGGLRPVGEYIIKRILNHIIRLHNLKIAPSFKNALIFLREADDDFRSKELIENIGAEYSLRQFVQIRPTKIWRFLFRKQVLLRPYRILSSKPIAKAMGINAQALFHDDQTKLERALIRNACETVNWHLYINKQLKNLFSVAQPAALVGMDDCTYSYPYIYQARTNHIPSIAFQHGAYGLLHEAYSMRHLVHHPWFDFLIVWNRYWQEQILKQNNHLEREQVHVGNNKIFLDYRSVGRGKINRSILIPYEFLGDTVKIGRYVKEFINQGFKVYLKTRNDEEVLDQLACYHLGQAGGKIILLDNITPEIMAEVGIVAGAMSTLLFDLIGYGKPIWILETKFRLRYDMVNAGLARLLKFSDLQKLDQIFESDVQNSPGPIPAELISDKSNLAALLSCLELAGVTPTDA